MITASLFSPDPQEDESDDDFESFTETELNVEAEVGELIRVVIRSSVVVAMRNCETVNQRVYPLHASATFERSHEERDAAGSRSGPTCLDS